MLDKEGSLEEEALHFMCRVMMTRDEKMRELVKRYFRPEDYFAIAKEFQQKILKGHFPEEIRDSFRKVLDYFGRSPIIVRSSSILEDGFGNAFAGKYESVFCVNAGTQEERLEKFEEAVKRVYASTLDESALEYRLQRNLHNRDEQMALLVQRVSGSYFGSYFMPYAAQDDLFYILSGFGPECGFYKDDA